MSLALWSGPKTRLALIATGSQVSAASEFAVRRTVPCTVGKEEDFPRPFWTGICTMTRPRAPLTPLLCVRRG